MGREGQFVHADTASRALIFNSCTYMCAQGHVCGCMGTPDTLKCVYVLHMGACTVSCFPVVKYLGVLLSMLTEQIFFYQDFTHGACYILLGFQ